MIRNLINWVFVFLEQHMILRYLIVGGSAGVSLLLVLYLLHNIGGMYYLLASVVAFVVAFFISFTFHKIWTFKSFEGKTHQELVLYFGNALFSLVMNTILLYLFVDVLHFPVILSQMIVGLMVACITFFISRSIFRRKTL